MVAGPKLLDAADSATWEKINDNVAPCGGPGPSKTLRHSDRGSPQPIFARVVRAENLADLLGKAPVTGRLRLVAALLRLRPIRAQALFRWFAHRSRLKLCRTPPSFKRRSRPECRSQDRQARAHVWPEIISWIKTHG
jgi:hypothetical protein